MLYYFGICIRKIITEDVSEKNIFEKRGELGGR